MTPPRAVANERSLWSMIRALLEQGRSIEQDYRAGKYPTYEHLSARVDQAAREQADSPYWNEAIAAAVLAAFFAGEVEGEYLVRQGPPETKYMVLRSNGQIICVPQLDKEQARRVAHALNWRGT